MTRTLIPPELVEIGPATNRAKIAGLAFGTGQVADGTSAAAFASAVLAIRAALGASNTLDSALLYGAGNALLRLGMALPATLGGCHHRGVTLSFKVGRVLQPAGPTRQKSVMWLDAGPYDVAFDYSRTGVHRAINQSLAFLNAGRRIAGYEEIALGSIPTIIYVHDPERAVHGANYTRVRDQVQEEAFAALDELKRDHKIAGFGVGTNSVETAQWAAEDPRTDVICLAGRFTLLCHEAPRAPRQIAEDAHGVHALLRSVEERGKKLLAAAPANGGALFGGKTYNYAVASPEVREYAEGLRRILAKHNASLPAAMLQFPRLFGGDAVTSVLAGIDAAPQAEENFAAMYDTEVPEDAWRALRAEGYLDSRLELDESVRARFIDAGRSLRAGALAIDSDAPPEPSDALRSRIAAVLPHIDVR